MVHKMVEAMSQLQEEKARLQELAALRERLALQDSDPQTTPTQLQNQVPGEDGRGRGRFPPPSRSEVVGWVTWNPPGHWRNEQLGSSRLARERTRGQGGKSQGPGPPILVTLVPHPLWFPETRTTAPECPAVYIDVRGAGRGRDAAHPESTPSARQPQGTKVIAEVAPQKTGRQGEAGVSAPGRRVLCSLWGQGEPKVYAVSIAFCVRWPGGPLGTLSPCFTLSIPHTWAARPLPSGLAPRSCCPVCLLCLCVTLPTSPGPQPICPIVAALDPVCPAESAASGRSRALSLGSCRVWPFS